MKFIILFFTFAVLISSCNKSKEIENDLAGDWYVSSYDNSAIEPSPAESYSNWRIIWNFDDGTLNISDTSTQTTPILAPGTYSYELVEDGDCGSTHILIDNDDFGAITVNSDQGELTISYACLDGRIVELRK